MWTALIIIVIVLALFTYDHLPRLLAHRERMAELKHKNEKESK